MVASAPGSSEALEEILQHIIHQKAINILYEASLVRDKFISGSIILRLLVLIFKKITNYIPHARLFLAYLLDSHLLADIFFVLG